MANLVVETQYCYLLLFASTKSVVSYHCAGILAMSATAKGLHQSLFPIITVKLTTWAPHIITFKTCSESLGDLVHELADRPSIDFLLYFET